MGMGMGAGSGGGPPGMPDMGETASSTGTDNKNTYDVYEYKFVVQMAWTPRSEKERLEARAARLMAKAEAEAAAAGESLDDAVEE